MESLEEDFIDSQTRSIVIDFFTYNPYADSYVVLTLEALFEANGMISSTVNLFNVKRSYYSGIVGYARLGCELVFVILLVFYFIMEVLEIAEDIQEKQKD